MRYWSVDLRILYVLPWYLKMFVDVLLLSCQVRVPDEVDVMLVFVRRSRKVLPPPRVYAWTSDNAPHHFGFAFRH